MEKGITESPLKDQSKGLLKKRRTAPPINKTPRKRQNCSILGSLSSRRYNTPFLFASPAGLKVNQSKSSKTLRTQHSYMIGRSTPAASQDPAASQEDTPSPAVNVTSYRSPNGTPLAAPPPVTTPPDQKYKFKERTPSPLELSPLEPSPLEPSPLELELNKPAGRPGEGSLVITNDKAVKELPPAQNLLASLELVVKEVPGDMDWSPN